MSAISSEFGLSVTRDGKFCVILEPPIGRTLGKLLLGNLNNNTAHVLSLTPEVLSDHRSKLGVPESQQFKQLQSGASANVMNYHFAHEILKPAVNTGSFTIDASDIGTVSPQVDFKYIINGITCTASFSLDKITNFPDITKILIGEIHRCYDRMNEMKEIATGHGIDISLNESALTDIATIERVQQAEARRRNLSAVNPTQRATKKIAKGFGSSAS